MEYRFWKLSFFFNLINGTISVISSDSPCKDGNAWFKTVPLKAFSDQVWIIYQCFYFLKCSFSFAVSLQKWLAQDLLQEAMKKLTEINSLSQKNDGFFHILYKIKVFNGSVVDLALPSLHGGSLEIKLPIPLIKPETAQWLHVEFSNLELQLWKLKNFFLHIYFFNLNFIRFL